MPPRKPEKALKNKALTVRRKSPNKAHRILARSHLSHGKLMKIIEAFSRWESVGMAAKSSGVSRISVGRVYNLIRRRLLDAGVFQSDIAYRNMRYDIENDEDEGHPWYDEDVYRARLAQALGRYRGIDPEHRLLYEAEAVFRVTFPAATEGDVRTLVMEAIKKGGPLNEPTRPEMLLEVYLDRIVWPEVMRVRRFLRQVAYRDRKLRE